MKQSNTEALDTPDPLEKIIRHNINASLIHDDRIADLVEALQQHIDRECVRARLEEIERLDYTINATHAGFGGKFEEVYALAVKLQKLRLSGLNTEGSKYG